MHIKDLIENTRPSNLKLNIAQLGMNDGTPTPTNIDTLDDLNLLVRQVENKNQAKERALLLKNANNQADRLLRSYELMAQLEEGTSALHQTPGSQRLLEIGHVDSAIRLVNNIINHEGLSDQIRLKTLESADQFIKLVDHEMAKVFDINPAVNTSSEFNPSVYCSTISAMSEVMLDQATDIEKWTKAYRVLSGHLKDLPQASRIQLKALIEAEHHGFTLSDVTIGEMPENSCEPSPLAFSEFMVSMKTQAGDTKHLAITQSDGGCVISSPDTSGLTVEFRPLDMNSKFSMSLANDKALAEEAESSRLNTILHAFKLAEISQDETQFNKMVGLQLSLLSGVVAELPSAKAERENREDMDNNFNILDI